MYWLQPPPYLRRAGAVLLILGALAWDIRSEATEPFPTAAHPIVAGAKITLLRPEAYADRYGPLTSAMAGRRSIFGAAVFRTGGLDAVRELAAGFDSTFAVLDEAARVVVREAHFDAVLEFVE